MSRARTGVAHHFELLAESSQQSVFSFPQPEVQCFNSAGLWPGMTVPLERNCRYHEDPSIRSLHSLHSLSRCS